MCVLPSRLSDSVCTPDGNRLMKKSITNYIIEKSSAGCYSDVEGGERTDMSHG